VKLGHFEKACSFFSRAAMVHPKEVKWNLMVASCYRRMEDYERSLKVYEDIFNEHPENIECKCIFLTL